MPPSSDCSVWVTTYERKEAEKSCSPYLANKAGEQITKYAVAAEVTKRGSYKLKAEKWLKRPTRQLPPHP